MPYTTLSQNGFKRSDSLLEPPESNEHPVLIARYMLKLVIFLQHLHPNDHEEIQGLSESPRAIMERLADLAISLVTTNEELLGSIEGLECVMIETLYQANVGNLRRSWVSGRRALSTAQLMGLQRSDNRAHYKVLDPKTTYYPQLMWLRIVFLDRYICLLLGLPQGCLDRSMASDTMLANDTPMGRLERIHCVVASRILERNESSPSPHDYALTQTIDSQLQQAARTLPSKWWLTPSLLESSVDSEARFWDMRRLFAQIFHYNLLNQVHLPYMLRSLSSGHKYEYSRITCVNASREVLSRFVSLRTFSRIAFTCRAVDFLAIMAAMTLLLAHLDSDRTEKENLLAHQYLSDRAMIEQTQENMIEVSRLNSDALSAQTADLLGRLLKLDIDGADGTSRGSMRVTIHERESEKATLEPDDDAVVSVHVPYFGIIKITRRGLSKEVHDHPESALGLHHLVQSQVEHRPRVLNSESLQSGPLMQAGRVGHSSSIPNVEIMALGNARCPDIEATSIVSPPESDSHETRTPAGWGTCPTPATHLDDALTQFTPPLQTCLSESLLQQDEFPGITAGGDDWAFQGVDMAFFETLMRSTEVEDEVAQ
jgi:hypothetical protein